MTRGLDHVVHAVADLDGAAAQYRQLGFTVGARNKHPWGTHNHVVQLPGFFIELLTLADPDKMTGDVFSEKFGAYNRDFAARGDGLSMVVLESQSAVDDEAAYRTAGIAASKATRFDREGKKPDGTPVKLAFTLAFAEDRHARNISFFTCQQHYPENFWNPAFQKHDNGVSGIASVVMVADAPAARRDFLLAYTGASHAREEGHGFSIDLPRGAIDVMTPAGFTERYGLAAPDMAHGPRLAAIRFAAAPGTPEQAVSTLGAGLIFGYGD